MFNKIKNFFNRSKKAIDNKCNEIYCKAQTAVANAKAEFYIDKTVGIIICVVVGVGGLSPWTFCGIAFLFVLLYASVQDHSTHEADDILSVMMLMLAVTNISEATVLSQLFGAAIVGGVQMLIALCGKKRMGIGGADIKLSTAAALLLGFYKGVIGFVLGLLIAVVAQLVITHRKKEQRTQPFALLPYLSVGLWIGYLI